MKYSTSKNAATFKIGLGFRQGPIENVTIR